uniref:Uncharacterized protein n=1 Tax=Tritonibacter mobilis F1926 TaxID=1265309 RepID=A0A1B1A0H4_9RHOB|nr:hypothetical protein K529_004875 [Tritonibacter mobilis F1926]
MRKTPKRRWGWRRAFGPAPPPTRRAQPDQGMFHARKMGGSLPQPAEVQMSFRKMLHKNHRPWADIPENATFW